MATLEDFKVFLEKVAWEAGLEGLVPTEDGLLQLKAGDIEMGMQFIPSVNKIFIYTEVGYLPEDAPSSLYRTLLCDQAAGYRTGGRTAGTFPESLSQASAGAAGCRVAGPDLFEPQ